MDKETFLKLFAECIADGSIKIQVNISPEYAQAGSGRWNISQTQIFANGDWYDAGQGNVELIEPN